MRRALVVFGVLLAGGTAACGGSGPSRSVPSRSVTSVLPQRPVNPVNGATVFRRECSSCHSLIGNESLRRQGGDLLGYTLTREELVEQTRQMPVRRPLTPAELSGVVDYVQALEKRAARAS